jgi:hypothetical protein
VIHKPGPGETLENVGNHLSSNANAEPSSADTPLVVAGSNSAVSSCDGMLQELNQTIKTIVERTEQDPVFERFLQEIIGIVEPQLHLLFFVMHNTCFYHTKLWQRVLVS